MLGAALASQVDAVVLERLSIQALRHPELTKGIDRVLLEQPGACPLFDVLAGAVLEDQASDPRALQQQTERQPRRAGTDDRDLGPYSRRGSANVPTPPSRTMQMIFPKMLNYWVAGGSRSPTATAHVDHYANLHTTVTGEIHASISDTPTSYVREPKGTHPSLDYPPYRSTALRHPDQPLVYVPQTITEITGPQLGPERVAGDHDNDLTAQHSGAPIGERITVSGRVLDTDGQPLRGTLVEIWQASAAGRYHHASDRWEAELDPNFSGAGRTVTDDEGRYRFITVKPGPYPWGNHHNAWRPAHIHFSLLGRALAQRLVTQMYFPGDPLFEFDPIFNSVRDQAVRRRSPMSRGCLLGESRTAALAALAGPP